MPQFNEILIALCEVLMSILSNQFEFEFDIINMSNVCLIIIQIFNIYVGDRVFKENVNETCSHFLELEIPTSLLTIFEKELPIDLLNFIVAPILSNIIQLLHYGNPDLVLRFSLQLNIYAFINWSKSDNKDIKTKSLELIEYLIIFRSDTISILMQEGFYDYYLSIIDFVSFNIKKSIIVVILASIKNSQSHEALQYFINEDIVDYLIESLGIPNYIESEKIVDVLHMIMNSNFTDELIAFTISQELEKFYMETNCL